MRYWLMKIEPDECSIDDLARLPGQTAAWTGVRNFQARNFMRDEMSVGDGVLYYHSSCAEPGIAGLAAVASAPYPDATQFDPNHAYHDPKSQPDKPRWFNVDIRFVRKTRLLPLSEMRERPELTSMAVLKRGNRLSITPVSAPQWQAVLRLLDTSA
jgi:predicted RNA-binding protein with PUA-like domain